MHSIFAKNKNNRKKPELSNFKRKHCPLRTEIVPSSKFLEYENLENPKLFKTLIRNCAIIFLSMRINSALRFTVGFKL